MDLTLKCPCGKPLTLGECCGRFIMGQEAPQSAEQVMRSRYTAYATQQLEYLVASHHPDTRRPVDRQDLKQFSERVTWLALDILEVVDGKPGDDQGWVEFIAHYVEGGEERTHHERSLFRRHQGRWFFHSAHRPKRTPVLRAEPKVGRNQPCPCGSGKKYKRCCADKT